MIGTLALFALAPLFTYDVRGDVSDLPREPNGVVRFRVVDTSGAGGPVDRAIVRLGPSTVVVDRAGREARAILHDGMTVGVTFTGPVTKSMPPQATAKRVVILKEQWNASGRLANLARTPNGLRFAVVDPVSKQPQAVATVTPKTRVLRLRNGRYVPVTPRELRSGQTVDLAYDGPTLLSMPPQGGAGIIVIR